MNTIESLLGQNKIYEDIMSAKEQEDLPIQGYFIIGFDLECIRIIGVPLLGASEDAEGRRRICYSLKKDVQYSERILTNNTNWKRVLFTDLELARAILKLTREELEADAEREERFNKKMTTIIVDDIA